MEYPTWLIELLVVVAAAAIGGSIFERLRLPGIIGFLLTGAVIGPGGFRLISDPKEVHTLAEFGVAFLLFEIGLELPVGELRRGLRRFVVSGALQVVVTVAFVAALGLLIGLDTNTAILMGMLIAMSSTAVVMRILGQRAELDAPHGRRSLEILLFQDLCVAPFLLIIPLLAGETSGGSISAVLGFGRGLVALILLFAVARFVFPWLLEQIALLRSPDLFSVFAFLLAIGTAIVAERIGLTLAVGAFIAGLALNSSDYGHQLFAEVSPWRGVLLGVFFTTVGMLLNLGVALAVWDKVLFYLGAVVILKAGIVALVLLVALRESLSNSVQTAMTLAQTGEFSFLIVAAASAAGLIDGQLEQVFISGSILTLVLTPFLIGAAPRVAGWLTARMDHVGLRVEPERAPGDIRDHVIIVGYGMAGRTLARVLAASQIAYRIVDSNPRAVSAERERGIPIIFGDATRPSVLERLGVGGAKAVVIAISDPVATRRCVSMVRGMSPRVQIVVRTRYVKELDGLLRGGATEVVAEEFESTIDLFSKVLGVFGVPNLSISEFAQGMRAEGYELLRESKAMPIDPWLAEVLEEVATAWVDVPSTAPERPSIAALGVRTHTGVNVVAVRREGETLANPSPEFCIQAGDSLLVLGSTEELRKLRELLDGGSMGKVSAAPSG